MQGSTEQHTAPSRTTPCHRGKLGIRPRPVTTALACLACCVARTHAYLLFPPRFEVCPVAPPSHAQRSMYAHPLHRSVEEKRHKDFRHNVTDRFNIIVRSEGERESHHNASETQKRVRSVDFTAGAVMLSSPERQVEYKLPAVLWAMGGGRKQEGDNDLDPFPNPGTPVGRRGAERRKNPIKLLPRPIRSLLVKNSEGILTYVATQMDRESVIGGIAVFTRELSMRGAGQGITWLPELLQEPAANMVDNAVDGVNSLAHQFFKVKDDREDRENERKRKHKGKY